MKKLDEQQFKHQNNINRQSWYPFISVKLKNVNSHIKLKNENFESKKKEEGRA